VVLRCGWLDGGTVADVAVHCAHGQAGVTAGCPGGRDLFPRSGSGSHRRGPGDGDRPAAGGQRQTGRGQYGAGGPGRRVGAAPWQGLLQLLQATVVGRAWPAARTSAGAAWWWASARQAARRAGCAPGPGGRAGRGRGAPAPAVRWLWWGSDLGAGGWGGGPAGL